MAGLKKNMIIMTEEDSIKSLKRVSSKDAIEHYSQFWRNRPGKYSITEAELNLHMETIGWTMVDLRSLFK